MWNFVEPGNPFNTYILRVNIVRGQNVSITVAKAGRIAALEESDANERGRGGLHGHRRDGGHLRGDLHLTAATSA